MRRHATATAIQEALALTPSWGRQHVEKALSGDPDAVGDLIIALHDYQRAPMVRVLYRHRIEPEAFRVALEDALTQTHHYAAVLVEAGSWERFVRWCRYAASPLPDTLPELVTIYRGAPDSVPHFAARGPSWTLDRKRAEVFARRGAGRRGVVVRATVPRSALIFYSNGRGEQEVIPDTLPPPGWKPARILRTCRQLDEWRRAEDIARMEAARERLASE